MRTGKRSATDDYRDLKLATYVDLATLPKIPGTFGHEKTVKDWGMLGNGPSPDMPQDFQGAGDCVFAGAAHETRMWTTEAGKPAEFTSTSVLSDYSTVTGYVIGNDATDRGTDVRDALKYRRATGIRDKHGHRHRIAAFVKLEPGNLNHLYAAMYLFGAVGIGIQFPETAMDQFDEGKPWDVVPGAQIDGGHYIPLVAKRAGKLDCVTWGKVQPLTVSFYETYCDEAWGLLSIEMLNEVHKTPEGLDLAHLKTDLGLVV